MSYNNTDYSQTFQVVGADLTGEDLLAHVRRSATHEQVLLSFSTDDGSISVAYDGTTNDITLSANAAKMLTVPPGTHVFDMINVVSPESRLRVSEVGAFTVAAGPTRP